MTGGTKTADGYYEFNVDNTVLKGVKDIVIYSYGSYEALKMSEFCFGKSIKNPYAVIKGNEANTTGGANAANDLKDTYNENTAGGATFWNSNYMQFARYNNIDFGQIGASKLYIKGTSIQNIKLYAIEKGAVIDKTANNGTYMDENKIYGLNDNQYAKAAIYDQGANSDGYYEIQVSKDDFKGIKDIIIYSQGAVTINEFKFDEFAIKDASNPILAADANEWGCKRTVDDNRADKSFINGTASGKIDFWNIYLAWTRYNYVDLGEGGVDRLYIKGDYATPGQITVFALEQGTEIVRNGEYISENGIVGLDETKYTKFTTQAGVGGNLTEDGYYELHLDNTVLKGVKDIVIFSYESETGLNMSEFYFRKVEVPKFPENITESKDAENAVWTLGEQDTITISAGATLKNATINAANGMVVVKTDGDDTQITGGTITFDSEGIIDTILDNTLKFKRGRNQGFLNKKMLNGEEDTHQITIYANGKDDDGNNYNDKPYIVTFELGSMFKGEARFGIAVQNVPHGIEITCE